MNRKMLGLAVIAILAMGLIVIANQFLDRPESDKQIGQPVLQGLKQRLDDVVLVHLESAHGATIIERTETGWSVAERADYPVNFEKLSDFLVGLADATYVERKTSRQEHFAALGVSDITEQDSNSTLVRIASAAASASGTEEEEWQLLIGSESTGIAGRFVRTPGVSQVWLADDIVNVDALPENWIDANIMHIDAEHISRVTFTAASGDSMVAIRDEESDEFVLPGLPDGAELRYDTIAEVLSRALVNVRATDVREREGSWEKVSTAEFQINDGSRITVIAMTDDKNEHWLRVDVSLAQVPMDAVAALDQARLSTWEFQVESHTYARFTKIMDDMIQSETQES